MGLQAGGSLFVSLNDVNHIHSICNIIAQGTFTIEPALCKTIYAMLLQAKALNQTVGIYYNGASFNCGANPNWGGVPSAYYVEIK
ncbi:hypothetical protein HAV22_19205 [Massilia sp. TW-1]|uniref:Uncharacterized protein n=1 Tax=Telluria antibiotica TaxID=2717319 RepID=A0ABX0PG08_9BURK|nr:hypothetical protein [Telluria antibiotica]NIA55766.1 hypothetical protein [Telluria antibiotica]